MTFLFHDTVSTSVGTVSIGFTERRLDVGDHAEPSVRAAALAELDRPEQHFHPDAARTPGLRDRLEQLRATRG